MEEILPKIAQYNPKLRVLIFLNDFVLSHLVDDIFNVAWNNYKILNIYVVDFLFPTQVYAYNPFDRTLVTFAVDNINNVSIRNFEKARIANLKGYKLKVTYFDFFLVADGKTDENGMYIIETLRFPDGEGLKLLSKLANFSVEFVKTANGITYGWRHENGTYTGVRSKLRVF